VRDRRWYAINTETDITRAAGAARQGTPADGKEGREDLCARLVRYSAADVYPFHMPGHKRRLVSFPDPYGIDITEIEGFDDLHHASGVLADAQLRAAALYGSGETHFLVNGSTCGILAAVAAAVPHGGEILMARNCHRSAYHAVWVNRLRAHFLLPEAIPLPGWGAQQETDAGLTETGAKAYRPAAPWLGGQIRADAVREALRRHPEIAAVLITSPTYEGVVSDIRAIAEAAHEAGAVLIVDEAHGAHFGLAAARPVSLAGGEADCGRQETWPAVSAGGEADCGRQETWPESSVRCGADLVIHSLHKTLPSLTQTALLHVNGPRVDRRRLRQLLSVYQTSSPSYVLMASMDRCIGLMREEGPALLGALEENLREFYEETKDLRTIALLRTDDPSRIVAVPLPGAGRGSRELARLLRETYRIEPEMVTPFYVLLLASVGDTREGFRRLADALHAIDEIWQAADSEDEKKREPTADMNRAEMQVGPAMQDSSAVQGGAAAQQVRPETVCTVGEAMDARQECVPLRKAAGRVAGDFLYLYPPGIPMLVPGERVSPETITEAMQYRAEGFDVHGSEEIGGVLHVRVLAETAER